MWYPASTWNLSNPLLCAELCKCVTALQLHMGNAWLVLFKMANPISVGFPNCAKLRRNYSAPPRLVWGPLIVRSCAAIKINSEKKSIESYSILIKTYDPDLADSSY